MKKYIIEYEDYDDILDMLGHGVPHSNLEHVTTVIIDLTDEEYEGLVGAGVNIKENEVGKAKLLYAPANIPFRSYPTDPPDISVYSRIPQSHAAGFDGTGVKVALIGSGCQDANAALCGPTLIRQDYTGLGVGDDNNHESKGCCIGLQRYSFFSPGLEVKNGMAYGCTLYSMRTIEGGDAAAITAINYCIANGIHIINCSFDTGTTGLTTAITAAMTAGIIVVCASGNSIGGQVAHPANIPGVIAVNGTSYDDAGTPFGSYITPDGHIQITAIWYNGGHYEFWAGGTSQVAWMTSFILAHYKQKYPSLNTQKAANILRRRALPLDGFDPTTSSSSRGKLSNYETGAGFIGSIN